MKPTIKGGGGSFNTFASFKLNNMDNSFENVSVKIDTGCSISTIPLSKFELPDSMLSKLKSEDINSGIDYLISYGVETGGRKHAIPKTYDDKMACTALKFKHTVSNFEISGVSISHDSLYINYDRSGNILIGMDILKDWDIHIGTIDTGETIFLGCPKEQINNGYLQELENTFNITRK